MHRESGNSYGEAATVDSASFAHHLLGHHATAIALYQQAIDGFAGLGNRWQQAETLARMGDACQAAGDQAAADDSWRHALTIMEELQHPNAADLHVKLTDRSACAPA